jgi:hypothetical protein
VQCGEVWESHREVRYVWYPLLVALAAGWVFVDARRRMAPGYWTAAVALGGPLGMAAYLALRPLHRAESREGGAAWQLLSKFVVVWTALVALAALSNLAFPFADPLALAAAWAIVSVPTLVVGIALKRSTDVERGPTGMLGALERWQSGPERTQDGRAYICRECGKEYPVTQLFCDGCGAWPGQSG